MIRALVVTVASLLMSTSCAGKMPTTSTPAAHVTSSSAKPPANPPPVKASAPEEEKVVSACDTSLASKDCKCEQGDIQACLKVADAAFEQSEHDVAILKAYAICQSGISEACFRTAKYMKKIRVSRRFGFTQTNLRDKAIAIDKEGCTKNIASACFSYGKLLFTGEFVTVDTMLGLQHLEVSCVGGHARACSFLAGLYEFGTRGVPKDKKRALELLENSCNANGAASCRHLGDRFAQNTAQAYAYYDKACQNADARACAQLGALQLTAAKFTDAHASFAKACDDIEEVASCADLGRLFEVGKGTTQDPAKAREFYKLACDEEIAEGCRSLGLLIAKGLGGARDWGVALELSEKACSLNLATGCKQAAKFKRSPPDWHCDSELACESLCSEGVGKSCTKLGELLAEKAGASITLAQENEDQDWPDCGSSFAAFERGCDRGDGIACYRCERFEEACRAGFEDGCVKAKGLQYSNAEKEGERRRIILSLKRTCKKGNVSACIVAANLMQEDGPWQTTSKAAIRLVARPCRAGNAEACAAQARLVYISRSVIGMTEDCDLPRSMGGSYEDAFCVKERKAEEAAYKKGEVDRAEQAKLFRKACQLGDRDSCFGAQRYGEDYLPAVVIDQMSARGVELFKTQSCR